MGHLWGSVALSFRVGDFFGADAKRFYPERSGWLAADTSHAQTVLASLRNCAWDVSAASCGSSTEGANGDNVGEVWLTSSANPASIIGALNATGTCETVRDQRV